MMHGPLNVKLWKIIYFYIAMNIQAQTLVLNNIWIKIYAQTLFLHGT